MSNFQKTPLNRSLNQFAERKVLDALQVTGRALPAAVESVSGAIVTVRFLVDSPFTLPQVTCPLFGPEYIRYPIQVGDKGVVFAADARLGQVSGLGGGTPDLTEPANLGGLVFFPCGNASWGSVDPEAVTIYGPNGVVLRDSGSQTTFVLTPSGVVMTGNSQLRLAVGSTSMVMDGTKTTFIGQVWMNGKRVDETHEHGGVSPGGSNTGGVV